MSVSYQHSSGRWSHGRRCVKAELVKNMKAEDFGYVPDKESQVFKYEGHYYVQSGNTAWDVGLVDNPQRGSKHYRGGNNRDETKVITQ